MKLENITITEIKNGYFLKTTIKHGINKWYTNNFFKNDEDLQVYKKELEKHIEDWHKFYYLIPTPMLNHNKHENRWCNNIRITHVLCKKETA